MNHWTTEIDELRAAKAAPPARKGFISRAQRAAMEAEQAYRAQRIAAQRQAELLRWGGKPWISSPA